MLVAPPLSDEAVAAAIGRELGRQQHQIELIASENIVSRDVLTAQVVELRRTVLNLRDHVIGTSAELGRVRAEAHLAEQRATVAERDRDVLWHELTQIKSSASWRVGQRVVRPFGIFRRMARGMYRMATGPRG